MKLYHGSPVENFRPTYGLGRDDHDYGRGFYMTADIDLARDELARKNMTELIYDPVRNPLARTFADLMKEVP